MVKVKSSVKKSIVRNIQYLQKQISITESEDFSLENYLIKVPSPFEGRRSG